MDPTTDHPPTDHFARLGLDRKLGLGEAEIEEAFQTRIKEAHPDRGGSEEEAAALNAAHEILIRPHRRARHLLELLEHRANSGGSGDRNLPIGDGLMDLFGTVAELIEETREFGKRREAASTTLAQALLAEDQVRLQMRCQEVGESLREAREIQENQFPEIDRALESDKDPPPALREVAGSLGFLKRWEEQVRIAATGLFG